MKQSTSRKCDDQEDIRISWNPHVHHRTYNSPKQKPYPTSNGFNPHGHTPISTISLVHMATPHGQFSPHDHTPISMINSIHMTTHVYLRPTQSTWPHSYVHDQFSPHGHTPISTINPVQMATILYLRSIQSTWPHSYVHDQFSPHDPHSCLHNRNAVLPSTFRFSKCYITWLPTPIHRIHT